VTECWAKRLCGRTYTGIVVVLKEVNKWLIRELEECGYSLEQLEEVINKKAKGEAGAASPLLVSGILRLGAAG
jgi:broad-specificity NMP kinase